MIKQESYGTKIEVKRERGKRNHTLPQPEMEREEVVTKYIYLQHSVIICIMKEINQINEETPGVKDMMGLRQ